MNLKLGSSLILLMSLLTTSALAQEDTTCPQLVQTAYETTQSACEEAGRDEACYGNNLVTADPQPEVEDFTFETPGDVADVSEIAALRLSSMDTSAEEWGISLIRIQADLPAETDDYVELLLFGNVEIENKGGETAETLATAEPETAYRPMQAFYFTSGTEDRPCEEAPDSGILIQTPEGAGEITVLVNEVVIDLGSTAYIQAQPSSDMVISTVEGKATITSQGTTVESPAGTFVTVPLDANGAANGIPSDPQPYDPTRLSTLPITILSREIEVAPALTEEASGTSGTLPTAGSWSLIYDSCTYNPNSATYDTTVVVADGKFATFELGTFTETTPGVFTSEMGVAGSMQTVTTLTFNSPTSLAGESVYYGVPGIPEGGTCFIRMEMK